MLGCSVWPRGCEAATGWICSFEGQDFQKLAWGVFKGGRCLSLSPHRGQLSFPPLICKGRSRFEKCLHVWCYQALIVILQQHCQMENTKVSNKKLKKWSQYVHVSTTSLYRLEIRKLFNKKCNKRMRLSCIVRLFADTSVPCATFPTKLQTYRASHQPAGVSAASAMSPQPARPGFLWCLCIKCSHTERSHSTLVLH